MTKDNKEFYFNTKSSFYDFEEYEINTIVKYRNEWYKSQNTKSDHPKTIPPLTNDYDFKSYLVEAQRLKEQVFKTQPDVEFDLKIDPEIKRIMDNDDEKEVEASVEQ